MADDGGTEVGHDEATIDEEQTVPSGRPRRWGIPFVALVVVLVVAIAATGSIWWATHRGPDVGVGSKHRVTVDVREVGPTDCWNNVGGVMIGGHYWYSDDHAPDDWGIGGVSGTFEVTAKSTNGFDGGGVFTADQGGTATFQGGFLHGVDPLNCRAGPPAGGSP